MAEPTYFASVLASVAGANKRHLALWNAHASKLVRVYWVKAAGAPTAAVTGLVIPLYVARITSAPTGGSDIDETAGGITKADTQDANPSSLTIMAGATGGAAEQGAAFGEAKVQGEETSGPGGEYLYQAFLDGSKTVVLRQNEGIVVKQGALASAGAINVTICFSFVDP